MSANPADEVERLVLGSAAWLELVSHCRRVAPNEACGVLGGNLFTGGQRADLAVPVVNLLADPRRYRMDPRGLMAAFDRIEDAGLEEVAYFHSHPASPPHPSQTDIAEARIGTVRMLIVSLQDPQNPSAGFYLLGDGGSRTGRLEIE
jgi:proteasome lid subunit RPN8/RPN11